ncbi:MAG: polysaccharide biosynthesis/export family protein [Fulvivirga sp.]|nr:polysaccharide biosynthesis/export family protein [Fulvivirga sp.]
MFKPTSDAAISEIDEDELTNKNYVIQPNDLLELDVFTKKGEFIIDPENRLLQDQRAGANLRNVKPQFKYLVQENGSVVLPMVGMVNLSGLTLLEAERKLIEAYKTYYKDPFVKLNYVNKRVIVLGGAGGKVIPLNNENTTVAEILALSGGFEKEVKSHNIRLLRDDKSYVIDFSTIEGYHKNNMVVQNEDVIYVEPVRRPFTEFIRDSGPVISVFSTLASLIAVMISIN